MIICSCNVLSDHAVRELAERQDGALRSASEVYTCFGCSAECGRCARTIRGILRDVQETCSKSQACLQDCPLKSHGQTAMEREFGVSRPLLAAE
jgi:bacterioferritin